MGIRIAVRFLRSKTQFKTPVNESCFTEILVSIFLILQPFITIPPFLLQDYWPKE
jgi:hypothetical protein